MEKTVPVDRGAEALVELFNANNVDYIFLNPGTDTVPVQEALSKFRALGKRTPEAILCLHESVAMSAAHGHFMISGRPQVLMVHVDAGTLQVGGALHNAQRGRIGVIFCAGRAPLNLEQDKLGGRWPFMWLQERRDQAGIVRDYVKWDYELRSTETIHRVVQRAFQITSTEPYGPVYLTLPLELLMGKLESVRVPDVDRHAAASTAQADTLLLDKAAEMLVQAEMPLIMTGNSGRHPQSVASLVELAEVLGGRVITTSERMNFPNTHPLCSGENPNPYLEDADVVLIIDFDVPYAPTQVKPGPEAKIIHIDIDPVKTAIPMYAFPADIRLEADSSKAIPVLTKMVRRKLTPEREAIIGARFRKIQEENRKLREEWRQLAVSQAEQKPISPEWLCYCVNQVIDEDTILLNDANSNTFSVGRQIQRTKAATLFDDGGTSLGWGLGAALGAKLAAPDKTVVTLMGDGCFIFGCPIPTLWAADVYSAPFLTVIFNNEQYYAPKAALQKAYGRESYSAKTGCWVGVNIKPSPDYSLVAAACNAYGRIVEDPAELQPALREGLDKVRGGKAVVLDVRIASEFSGSYFSMTE